MKFFQFITSVRTRLHVAVKGCESSLKKERLGYPSATLTLQLNPITSQVEKNEGKISQDVSTREHPAGTVVIDLSEPAVLRMAQEYLNWIRDNTGVNLHPLKEGERFIPSSVRAMILDEMKRQLPKTLSSFKENGRCVVCLNVSPHPFYTDLPICLDCVGTDNHLGWLKVMDCPQCHHLMQGRWRHHPGCEVAKAGLKDCHCCYGTGRVFDDNVCGNCDGSGKEPA